MSGSGRGGVVKAAAWPLAIVLGMAVPVEPHRVEAAPTIESLPLAATYGDAVHAYFAGDYQRSYDDLSSVIEAGSTDPRAYYFRGLAALKLGRLDESEADFSMGATREAEGTGTWPVARSLERIQGCDRLKLERYRVRARVALLQENRRRSTLRYLEVEQAAPEVQRTRRPTAEAVPDEANPFEEVRPAEQPADPMPESEPMPETEPAAEEMPEPVAEPAEPAMEEPAEELAEPAMEEPAEGLAGEEPSAEEPMEEPAGEEPLAEPAAEEPMEELAPEREEDAEQVDEQMEEEATATEDVAEQVDEQMEEGGAAAEDMPEQVDEQMEQEAAEGENAAEQMDQQAEAEPL